MADPPDDPFNDPYDFDEELASIFMPNQFPNLDDLSLNNTTIENQNNSYPIPLPQPVNRISGSIEPVQTNPGEIGLINPEVNFEMISEMQGMDDLEGFIQEEINDCMQGMNGLQSGYGDGGNAGAVSTWRSEQNLSRGCSGSCQVLRQMHHTNGEDVIKLEIHGTIGFISHVIFGVQPNPTSSEFFYNQLIDFSDKSIGEVEHYLRRYCEDRARTGFVLMDNPLASFYRAISVGLDNPNENYHNNNDAGPSFPQIPEPATAAMAAGPSNSVPVKTDQSGVSSSESRRKKKTPLAEQRCRTKEMTLKDISSHFKVPIQEAADKLRLSVTVLKKICRRSGLDRWPQRKLTALLKKTEASKARLRSANAEEKAAAEAEIAVLEEEIDKLCYGRENKKKGI